MILSMMLLAVAGTAPPAPLPAGADAFIRDTLELERYRAAPVDLNGDGADEVVVYATDRQVCGSGGCALFVLTPDGDRYRVLARTSVTRPPIRMLSTSSHGWRDLAVRVAGGGIRRAYEVRLRFDGRTYPANPTVAPALPASGAGGRVLID